MGPHTFSVSVADVFVANRVKLGRALWRDSPDVRNANSADDNSATVGVVVFLQGGASTTRYDSDHEPLFRQESYFWWLSGVRDPDCSLSIQFGYSIENISNNNNNSKNGDEIGNDWDPSTKSNQSNITVTGDTTATTAVINEDPRVVMTTTTTLYVPRLDADYATVMGKIRSLSEWKDMYWMDSVRYTDEIESCLRNQFCLEDTEITESRNDSSLVGASNRMLLLMQGTNSDSGTLYQAPDKILQNDLALQLLPFVDCTVLFPILAECRVLKSPAELLVLQHVTEITSFAHAYVMRNFGFGPPQSAASSTHGTFAGDKAVWEYQAESLFRHYCYYNYGARIMGYTAICGCGPDAAILHYGHAGEPNARQGKERDICLFDMGAEYFGYGSDVTCSFPASGIFSPMQTVVYQAVYNAQVAVYQMMRPGVSWVDCHIMAEKTILTALINAGLVVLPPRNLHDDSTDEINTERSNVDTTVDDMVRLRLGAVFMPHGLGHLIGIDTHDVGGYLPGHPTRSNLPGLAKLRTARILQANMVLTVEPGCYFINHVLDAALAPDSPLRPYLNAAAIHAYRGFGGVRLEDVIQVTETGIVNYTLCPRTIPEVESVMAGAKWPPLQDEAPKLRRMRLTTTTPLPSPPSK